MQFVFALGGVFVTRYFVLESLRRLAALSAKMR